MQFVDQWFEYGLLLAVSGGADSSAMLHYGVDFARRFGLRLPIVGHVNHRLRGAESDSDEDFVRLLAEEYGLRFFSHSITDVEWASDLTGSVEASARSIRYDFLSRVAGSNGCRFIATAHTAGDQVETVLHRIIRGTGVAGLRGISKQRQLNHAVTLVRPMLNMSRESVLKYLESIGRGFRTDSSNLQSDFTRNKIRNNLLPILRSVYNSDVDNAILRLAAVAGEADDIAADWFDLRNETIIAKRTQNEIVIKSDQLQLLKFGMIREFIKRCWEDQGWSLREMGFERWNEITEFFLHGKGTLNLPTSIIAEHQNNNKNLFVIKFFDSTKQTK
jgi:tRNA(Ile)-lysidine synthase